MYLYLDDMAEGRRTISAMSRDLRPQDRRRRLVSNNNNNNM